jgi:hypothetical protein
MYLPIKQDVIIKELTLLKSLSFKNLIDKNDVMRILNCSEKTAERRLFKAGLFHVKNDVINLLKDYDKGLTTSELAIKYNCSLVNVNALAKRHNFKRPVDWLNTIKADYNFFDIINTEEKAYILGFIAADGYVGDYELKIALNSKDIEILEKIKICLKSDVKIKTFTQLCTFTGKITNVCSLSFSNLHMISKLRSLGFTRNKTTDFKFPNIPKEFFIHFIRGYFDGDGSMSKSLCKDGYTRYCASIAGTKSFLNEVKSLIEADCSIKFNTKLYKRFNTENCCYALTLSGKQNVNTFLDLLYKDSSIFLDRKYNKYLSFKL